MKIVYPDYYNEFKCIADRCKHNCCIGWEIDVDEKSLQLYREHTGTLKERFFKDISCDGVPHFILGEGERCPFLNNSNLCDIYSEMGEQALCQICTDHPRFRNFYSDFTEIGLGLCCEEACRIILGRSNKFKLVSEDDFSCNEYETEFLSLRQNLFEILQEREVPFETRAIKMFEFVGATLQTEDFLPLYNELEWMERDITEMINSKNTVVLPDNFLENLCTYFLYRHLSEALDDGRFAERVAFAYISTKVIERMCNSTDFEEITECARIYSSEIEYSEENIEAILERISDIIIVL